MSTPVQTPPVAELKTNLKGMPLSQSLPVRTFMQWAFLLVVIFAAIAVTVIYSLVESREKELLTEVRSRTGIQAQGKAEVIRAFLDGQFKTTGHLATSDLVRLFVAESVNSGTNTGLSPEVRASLVAQKPYMMQVMEDFSVKNAMLGAAVVDNAGNIVIASSAFTLPEAVKAALANLWQDQKPVILPLRAVDNKVVIDTLQPIFALSVEGDNTAVVGALVASQPISDKLASILSLGPLTLKGERVHLLQTGSDGVASAFTSGAYMPLAGGVAVDGVISQATTQSRLFSPIDSRDVFAGVGMVADSPFTIVHEYEAANALAPLAAYARAIYGLVILGVGLVLALILGMIGYLLGQRNRVRVRLQEQTLQALVRAVEIRDPYLAGHHQRVAKLTLDVANKMGLPIPARSTLFYAAMLSGVGKIFVPEQILTKPGKLDAAERQIMESHVGHAIRVLKDIEFDLPIADVIHHMYERLDGTGYPNRVAGTAIHPLATVLGACDMFAALTEPRSYRDALSPLVALSELKAQSGKFDPKVIQAIESVKEEKKK